MPISVLINKAVLDKELEFKVSIHDVIGRGVHCVTSSVGVEQCLLASGSSSGSGSLNCGPRGDNGLEL